VIAAGAIGLFWWQISPWWFIPDLWLATASRAQAQSRGELNGSSDDYHVHFGHLGFGCSGLSHSKPR